MESRRWVAEAGESTVLRLPSQQLLAKVHVRNTHAGEADDCCAKLIRLEFSADGQVLVQANPLHTNQSLARSRGIYLARIFSSMNTKVL